MFTLRKILVNPFEMQVCSVIVLGQSKYFRNQILGMESLDHFQYQFAFIRASGYV